MISKLSLVNLFHQLHQHFFFLVNNMALMAHQLNQHQNSMNQVVFVPVSPPCPVFNRLYLIVDPCSRYVSPAGLRCSLSITNKVTLGASTC